MNLNLKYGSHLSQIFPLEEANLLSTILKLSKNSLKFISPSLLMSMVSTKLSSSSGDRDIDPLCLARSSQPALSSSRDRRPGILENVKMSS